MGYDGVELACWGDHFDVERALASPDYVHQRWRVLQAQGLGCHAIANHLVGQAVCDLIDERHRAILPPEIWGDGEPEGVRQRAATRMIDTAKAARAFFDARPGAAAIDFPATVTGFTGSSIWHAVYAFPPTSQAYLEQGFDDFARALAADSRRLRRGRRELRPGGASDRDRLRHRQRAARTGSGRPPPALRLQLRSLALRLPGRGLHAASCAPSANASSTST